MAIDRFGPLRFEPLFKSAVWGGYRLFDFHGRPRTSAEPIGETWVLSDQGENCSKVINGTYAGRTLRQLMTIAPQAILGKCRSANGRFPLLLKFLDTLQPLSVQVHPNDEQANMLAPPRPGDVSLGKTEAWVILESEEDSLLYAGLKSGVDRAQFESALRKGILDETLHSFNPVKGDCVHLPAGTVHAIGANLMLFEVQQTSDLTYRLYDWNRVDHRTGKPRALHIEESLLCTDFSQGPTAPRVPVVHSHSPNRVEALIRDRYFGLNRLTLSEEMTVGVPDECRVIVPIEGQGELHSDFSTEIISAGDIVMLPATMGNATIVPNGKMTVLEVLVPV
ncbi:type I phosphomannose isomerase catalytic subunit [Tuwongella immobilis]|uniref:Phosphomannose isomerase type I catalytic domain-containing protein n=1 Tax=Tuwongella immobilis TaxID=692036 RepID=A0A6C2YQL4_9BACT|nr:type I phosphomannose isomerase catalytic subunit [Tuwongella immobilis]VIP03449.1 mannose-6-phosphate isomerase : Phosphomannose isomerase OS=Singulisphaera acidiphila (strain ATCC BAA-1392 / DSM 18658 / VKM B-2454 / MOB10) GN=Sinac_2890 PE=4 SV=1: PMI_typeI [Tuwongella immobilis]VTS04270.1 mannose-6-phosphate isomerase : Phosphomannose isomerase OS=Singulisphaera acidiphila (strain ATCC BAA-1392 / DSM 18658 / VKM B-2454 / MOB10) GN=Sinac_2890 PE=4 SV=1: PMI_typeI [Tuwongella immobilis]